MNTDIEKELIIINKSFHALGEGGKEKLRQVVQNPTKAAWDAAFALPVGVIGPRPVILWAAVASVDKTFPRHLLIDLVTRVPYWNVIPDQETLVKAIRKAAYGLLFANPNAYMTVQIPTY